MFYCAVEEQKKNINETNIQQYCIEFVEFVGNEVRATKKICRQIRCPMYK